MVAINELMIVTGQFLAFAMNAILDALIKDPHVWRWMLGVAVVLAVGLLVGMLTLPDSPRWYALKSRLDDTERVLSRSPHPHARPVAHRPHVRQHAAATGGTQGGRPVLLG